MQGHSSKDRTDCNNEYNLSYESNSTGSDKDTLNHVNESLPNRRSQSDNALNKRTESEEDRIGLNNCANLGKFANMSFSYDDMLQSSPRYNVITRYYSDTANPEEIRKHMSDIEKAKPVEKKDSKKLKFSYSLNDFNLYQNLNPTNEEANRTIETYTTYSLPIIRTVYNFFRKNSNQSEKKSTTIIDNYQPSTSVARTSIEDDMSYKSATDNISDDLDAIRAKIIGSHPEITRLIIKQGLLMSPIIESKTGNVHQQYAFSVNNDYQPPPPYTDAVNEGTGGQGQPQRTQQNQQSGGGNSPPAYIRFLPTEHHRAGEIENFDESFFNRKIRHKFIQKVYSILAVQLSITCVFVLICTYVTPVRNYVKRDFIGMICASVATMMLYITMTCYSKTRRIFPLNFILLFGLTAGLTYLMGILCAKTSPHLVLITIGVTVIACTLVSIFAWQTKWDITRCGFILFLVSLVFVIYTTIATLVYIFTQVKILYLIACGIGMILMLLYLMYDTQQIVGGRRVEMSPEEYIYGALTLYTDIVMFFYYLLQLVRGG